MSGENGGENFSAGCDAMSEVAESHNKSEDPDNGNGAADRVAAADQPGDHGDDPSAHDPAPEDMDCGGCGGFSPIADERVEDVGPKRAGAGAEQREQQRSGNVGDEDDSPQAQSRDHIAAFGKDERDGVEGVFGKELAATEDDGHESHGIKQKRDKLRGGRIAKLRGDGGDTEASESHGEASDDAGDGEGCIGAGQLAASITGHVFKNLNC